MPRITDPEQVQKMAKKDKMIDIERDSKIDYSRISKEYPVQVGPQFEGDKVRKDDFQVEFGGPNAKGVFFLRIREMDEVENGKVTIIGSDINEIEAGSACALGILVEVAGVGLERDMESVPERRLHSYLNYLEGVWSSGLRTDAWIRIHKDSYRKGLNSFNELGRIFANLFMADFSQIKKVACTFITDPEKVEKIIAEAKKVYSERDQRVKDMREEDVEEFYSCTLCSSFAPSHVCIVTPDRPSLCGAMTWFDAKMTHTMEPSGYVGKLDKKNLLDSINYEYEGVNEVVQKKSMGSSNRLYLHSIFSYPHTSCGCFQGLLFFISKVNGVGYVHREFRGQIPTGRTFSSMAGEASGGKQTEGLVGASIEYLRSSKFLAGDGGFKRVVWLPKEIKEDLKNTIPEELFNKVATEDEVKNIEELVEFLKKVGHPVITKKG
jgi:acetyl-CoA decarbonylase/synthase complex subunit beta